MTQSSNKIFEISHSLQSNKFLILTKIVSVQLFSTIIPS